MYIYLKSCLFLSSIHQRPIRQMILLGRGGNLKIVMIVFRVESTRASEQSILATFRGNRTDGIASIRMQSNEKLSHAGLASCGSVSPDFITSSRPYRLHISRGFILTYLDLRPGYLVESTVRRVIYVSIHGIAAILCTGRSTRSNETTAHARSFGDWDSVLRVSKGTARIVSDGKVFKNSFHSCYSSGEARAPDYSVNSMYTRLWNYILPISKFSGYTFLYNKRNFISIKLQI